MKVKFKLKMIKIIMLKILFILVIVNISLTKVNRYAADLSDLEVKDTDPEVIKKNLEKKYFLNKYKKYPFEDLQKFYYELKLGVQEIPDVKTLKSWKKYKRHTLELIDHFLEEHKQDEYTYAEIMKLIHDNHFKDFRSKRFQEIFEFAKTQHEEDLKEHNEKTFPHLKKKEEEIFTDEI